MDIRVQIASVGFSYIADRCVFLFMFPDSNLQLHPPVNTCFL